MSNRKPLIAGNWKLHNTLAESQALAGAIAAHVGTGSSVDVVLAPVATAILIAIGTRMVGAPTLDMTSEKTVASTANIT